MKIKEIATLYLYNEVENWEWSYQELIEQITSDIASQELDTIEVVENKYIDNELNELTNEFYTDLEKELASILNNYVTLKTIAIENMNKKIKQDLKIILDN